jgi:heme exporter protein D
MSTIAEALGPHAGFIVAAYVAVVVVLAALTTWIVADERRQRRILGELEAQGVKRRASADSEKEKRRNG